MALFLSIWVGFVHADGIPRDGLVAEYLLDGNANDTSGNGNNGVNTTAAVTANANGQTWMAMQFNGVDSTIDASHTQNIFFGNSDPFSVSIWFKPEDNRTAFFLLKNANYGFQWSGVWSPLAYYNGSYHYSAKTDWVIGRWYHVTMTDDWNAHVKLYVDGALDKDDAFVYPNRFGWFWLEIGTYKTSQWFKWGLDNLRIYNRVLTDGEVRSLQSEWASGLVAQYLLDGNANDTSGNGNNGVDQNVSYADGSAVMHKDQKSNVFVNNFVWGGTSGVTFCGWVKYNSLPTGNYNPGIVMAGGGNYPYVTHFLRYQNYPSGSYHLVWTRVKHGIGNSFDLSYDVNFETGKWYYVCWTTSGTQSALYLDGTQVASGPADTDNGSNGENTDPYIRLGREFYSGDDSQERYLDGSLKGIRIYNRALSSSEIQALYNGAIPVVPTNPNTSVPVVANSCGANMSCNVTPASVQTTASSTSGNGGAQTLNVNNLGDPITLSTGESIYSDTFLRTPGIGMPFEFTLTNRTKAVYDGPVGFGWDHNSNIFLGEQSDGSVSLYDGKLGIYPFPKNQDGSFGRNVSLRASLSKDANNHYVIAFDSGLAYSFGENLRIASMTDRNGNVMTYSYDADNKLTKVTNTVGQDVAFAYFDDGRLKSATDATGRHVDLTYYGDSDPLGNPNDLKSVTIVNGDASKTVSYVYSKVDGSDTLSHNMVKLIDAKGQAYVENTFDVNDRVVAQKYGDGTLTYEYTLDSANQYVAKTKVTNKRGTVTEYSFDAHGNQTSMVVHDASGTKTYSYAYDDAGHMVSETKPLGNGAKYVYDTNGNMTQKREKADMSATDSDDDLVTNFVYDDTPLHNAIEHTPPSGIKTQYAYDAHGNLTQSKIVGATVNAGSTTDVVVTNEYDAHGRLLRTTDPLGNITAYEYDANSNVTKITKGLRNAEVGLDSTQAVSTTYTYDTHGNPLTTTDPEGNVSTFTYDAFDRMSSSISPAGIKKTFVFGADNKLEKQETEVSQSVKLTETNAYDILDETISSGIGSSAEDRRVVSIERDKNGNVVSTTAASGLVTKYAYDEFERVTQKRIVVDPNDAQKDIVESYEYDANGNKTKVTDALGNITTIAYDRFDRPVSKTDAAGNKTSFSYDKEGRVIETKLENTDHQVLSISRVTYNSLGKPLQQSTVSPETQLSIDTSYTYDAMGNVLTQNDANGNVTTYEYDNLGRLKKTTDALGNSVVLAYDKRGLVTSKSLVGADGTTVTTLYLYDGDGRKLQETDALGHIKKYAYNALGRVVKKTDEAGNVTDYAYDIFGNLLAETSHVDGSAVVIRYEYNVDNKVTKLTDANGNETRYQYDVLGRLTKKIHADGTEETYTYDKNGNLVSTKDVNGTVVTNTYDVLNRLTQRDIATGTGVLGVTQETYSYDALGRLVSAGDSQSGSLAFAYNPFGQLLSETQNGTEVDYAYDKNSNRLSVSTGTGYLASYSYDALNRLAKVGFGGEDIANYAYTGTTLDSTLFGNGTSITQTHDALQRLASLAYSTPETPQWSYAYSPNGNILSDGQRSYSYDALDRLTGVTSASGSLVSAQDLGFSYDAMGNRLSTTDNLASKTDFYSGSILNQYLQVTQSGSTSSGMILAYDANGNLKSNGKFAFAYDYRNRLVEVRDASDNSLVASYAYDVLGRRVQKAAEGKATTYLYAGSDAIIESNAVGSDPRALVTKHIYGNGTDDLIAYEAEESGLSGDLAEELGFCQKRVLPYESGFSKYGWNAMLTRCHDLETQSANSDVTVKRYYLQKDHEGSTMALVDASGSVVQQYSYDAFGTPYVSTGSGAFVALKDYEGSLHGNDRFFTGRELEKGLDMYYYRARFYDPGLGRFIQRDPVGTSDQINLYTYVGNNPVGFTDPSGKVAKAFLSYEGSYIVGGVYNSANHMSFGLLDKGLGLNDRMQDCSNWASAGWCDGKDKAYMLDTAGMMVSAPSDIMVAKGFVSWAAETLSSWLALARDTRGATNFFGALKDGVGMTSPFELNQTHKLDRGNLIEVKNDIQAAGGRILETIKYVVFKGEKYIVDWNHRTAAAKDLWITEVPTEEVQLPYASYRTEQDLFY